MSEREETSNTWQPDSASFRDPAGFVFWRDRRLFRQINLLGAKDYELLIASGLYQELVSRGWLVAHIEVDSPPAHKETAYKVIQPYRLPMISYPYEWCFGQLKDAALLTLDIQILALQFGMSLKDASAYNVQFEENHPLFIDTLSFETRRKGRPWVAYRQFCQHFLAPLALMAKRDIRFGVFQRSHIDGVPLNLASSLLPLHTYLNPGLVAHLHLHARAQSRYESTDRAGRRPLAVNEIGLAGLLRGLRRTVEKLVWEPSGTEWADYYEDNNYSCRAFASKQELTRNFLALTRPNVVWDLGANTGIFSDIAAEQAKTVVAFDIDSAAVERHYRRLQRGKEACLPLVMDLANPSSDIGWACEERASLLRRGPADMVMLLAMIHHLALTNNTPFARVASFLSRICRHLIIEFVPLIDSQAQRLVRGRDGLSDGYRVEVFEAMFDDHFEVMERSPIADTERVLYLMKNRGAGRDERKEDKDG